MPTILQIRQSRGFTLVELIVVIATLGILAAVAIPRFIDVQSNAREAVIRGLNGAIRSAAALAHAQWVIDGSTGSTVTMDGLTVDMESTSGYPLSTANGITRAANISAGTSAGGNEDFLVTYVAGDTATYRNMVASGGGLATCQVVYDEDDGSTTVTVTTC